MRIHWKKNEDNLKEEKEEQECEKLGIGMAKWVKEEKQTISIRILWKRGQKKESNVTEKISKY